MTVSELIEELEKFNGNKEVEVRVYNGEQFMVREVSIAHYQNTILIETF